MLRWARATLKSKIQLHNDQPIYRKLIESHIELSIRVNSEPLFYGPITSTPIGSINTRIFW